MELKVPEICISDLVIGLTDMNLGADRDEEVESILTSEGFRGIAFPHIFFPKKGGRRSKKHVVKPANGSCKDIIGFAPGGLRVRRGRKKGIDKGTRLGQNELGSEGK